MQRFFLTGDCHGEFEKISFFCQHHKTTTDDYMIILGDVGLNFCMDHRDEERKAVLDELPVSFFCIHGNHEERPYNISSYRQKKWHGGIVYYEETHPTILFAKDGEVYDLAGKKGVAIGGAYSADKSFRLLLGLPWFSEEQPSEQIKAYVETQLEKQNWTVDFVFSHTCPLMYEPWEKYAGIIDKKDMDQSTEQWLDRIASKLDYKCWYFGHYHDNICYERAELLYEEIKELGKTGFIQKLGNPIYRTEEEVLFYIEDQNGTENNGYGVIENVEAYGTEDQYREVSYNIKGIIAGKADKKQCFLHVRESVIERIYE